MRCIEKFKTAIWLAFVASFIAGCATTLPPPAKPAIVRDDFSYTKAQLEWLINKEMSVHKLTGLSITLVAGQQVIWQRGFGFADRQARLPVTANTRFRAGSLTKTLNALAIMRLVEQGALQLNDDVAQLLPELDLRLPSGDAARVTVSALLSHQGGLPSDLIKGMWTRSPPEDFSAALAYLDSVPLTHIPNTQFVYSNLGHDVLAKVIEKRSGEAYVVYMNKMLQELGLSSARISADPNQPVTAQGYLKQRRKDELWLRDIPAAGLSIDSDDLSRLLKVLLTLSESDNGLISTHSFGKLLEDVSSDKPLNLGQRIGLGFFYYEDVFHRRFPVVGHGGAAVNHRALYKIAPEQQLAVAVMSNSRNASPSLHRIVNQALLLLYEGKTGKPAPRAHAYWPSPQKADRISAQQLIGHYATLGGLAKIFRDANGTLKVSIAGKTLTLYQRHNDGYFYARYALWGLFPINIGALGNMGLAVRHIEGRDYLVSFNTLGAAQLLGERLEATEIHPAWLERVGAYRVLNPLDVIALPSGGIKVADGFLVAFAKTDRGEQMQVVLLPQDAERAIVAGSGRGLGETVFAEQTQEGEVLRYSNILFQKK